MAPSPTPSTPGSGTAPALSRQGMVTIIGAVLLLGGLLIGMAQEQIWVLFTKPVEFITDDANGLSPGLPVRLSGFTIGRVDRVDLRRDAKVLVTLRIQPSYRSMLGPRSLVRLDQEGLVGSSYLNVTADPTSSGKEEGPLRLSYDPPVDVKDLLVALAQSRLPLNRLLNQTATLAETSLPRAMHEVERTVRAAGSLSLSLQQQSVLTATQARQTLRTYESLGQDGRQSLSASSQDLDTLLPLLRDTLKDVRTTAQTSQTLLDRLSGSWLMPLLEAPPASPAPPTRNRTP